MTSHLSDAALMETVETGQAHPHLASCDRCRSRADGLRHALVAAREIPPPEPSPLFWDHFRERVGAAVRMEQAGRARTGGHFWWRAIAAASIVLVLAVLVTERTGWAPTRLPFSVPPVRKAMPLHNAAHSAAEPRDLALRDDASWRLVTQVSAGVDLDAAADEGFGLQPGSAERAAAQLTPRERRVLVELLQAAVKEGSPVAR